MSDLQALLLGIVQGVTEWLPISSTAHLRVVPELLGWPDPGAAFTAVSQWGTLLAALIYFRRDIAAILLPGSHPDGEEGASPRLLVPVIVGSIPVVVAGLLLHKAIEGQFRSLYVIGTSLIVFAILLAAAESKRRVDRSIDTATISDGLWVGIGQAFSLIPGASRSGTTMTVAMLLGFERATAARFSFLLSLPAIFAAGLYELLKYRHEIFNGGMGRPVVVATTAAFVVGWASIDWLLKFLRNHPTYVFIAYRILAGAGILLLLRTGTIKP